MQKTKRGRETKGETKGRQKGTGDKRGRTFFVNL